MEYFHNFKIMVLIDQNSLCSPLAIFEPVPFDLGYLPTDFYAPQEADDQKLSPNFKEGSVQKGGVQRREAVRAELGGISFASRRQSSPV